MVGCYVVCIGYWCVVDLFCVGYRFLDVCVVVNGIGWVGYVVFG